MACSTPVSDSGPTNGIDFRPLSSRVRVINSSPTMLAKVIDPGGCDQQHNGRRPIRVERHHDGQSDSIRPPQISSRSNRSQDRSVDHSSNSSGYLDHGIDKGLCVGDDSKEIKSYDRKVKAKRIPAAADHRESTDDMNAGRNGSFSSVRDNHSMTDKMPLRPSRDTSSEIQCYGFERKVNIRPITAIPSSLKAKRYLDNRLKDMYKQRRAVSSLPRTHGSLGGVSAFLGTRARTGSRLYADSPDGCHMDLRPLAKFRLVGRITLCLLQLMRNIIRNSQDKANRSAAELQWFTLYGQGKDTQLAFNKDIYSRNRVMTHIPEWALSILALEPEQRTEEHCRLLHALLRGLKSFDKFTEQIQMSMCRAFRLEKLSEGRVVLKQNRIGMYFYFIYSGSVFVNTTDETADGTTFTRTIATLSRGDSFGELALLKDIRRTASVSVREKCELLVVDKDVFARVCPKIFERELEEKHQFVSKVSLFPSKWWPYDKLRALSMQAQIQDFKINKVVVPDSALEDWIYCCMEGKCQVIRCISLTGTPKTDSSLRRKHSDIVLSEEIIELLSSAAAVSKQQQAEDEPDEDMKENLLSSLGLDYVSTRKGACNLFDNDHNKARLRALQGLDEATTLSALMKKNAEARKHDVYLKVGELESGDVFDMQSLLKNDKGEYNPRASSLLLVSGGAKILKIRKSAFFAQASHQALEHTKTLTSKQIHYTDEYLIQSYKEKKQWEIFKSSVVREVIQDRVSRTEHIDLMNRKLKPSSAKHHDKTRKARHRRAVSQHSFRGDDDTFANVQEKDRKEDSYNASRLADDSDDGHSSSSSSSLQSTVSINDHIKILLTEGVDSKKGKVTTFHNEAVKRDIFSRRIKRNSSTTRSPSTRRSNIATNRPHTAHAGIW